MRIPVHRHPAHRFRFASDFSPKSSRSCWRCSCCVVNIKTCCSAAMPSEVQKHVALSTCLHHYFFAAGTRPAQGGSRVLDGQQHAASRGGAEDSCLTHCCPSLRTASFL